MSHLFVEIMMKRLFLFGIFALRTLSASACSFPLVPIEQQTEKAEEIFIATLQEAKLMPRDDLHQSPWIEGRFLLGRTLKGEPHPKSVTLATGMGRGDCGVAMMVSAKYVIFKEKKDTGIGDETGTHIIEDFQEEELAEKIQLIVHRQQSELRKK